MLGLTACTDCACSHIMPGVGLHGWPPEMPPENCQGAPGTGMTGELSGVGPLEDLGEDRGRHKKTVSRTITWVRLLKLSVCDDPFSAPGQGSHHTLIWKNQFRHRTGLRVRVLAGESIRFYISWAWTVSKHKVKSTEKKCPSSLPGV